MILLIRFVARRHIGHRQLTRKVVYFLYTNGFSSSHLSLTLVVTIFLFNSQDTNGCQLEEEEEDDEDEEEESEPDEKRPKTDI